MREGRFGISRNVGFEEVITRKNSEMEVTEFYQLSLPTGGTYELVREDMEMGLSIISGKWKIKVGDVNYICERFDTVYTPAGKKIFFRNLDGIGIIYMGAAPSPNNNFISYKTCFDKNLPEGDRRQIHGKGMCQREVFVGIGPKDPALRLIMGFTWGGKGQWTGWPPHEHTRYLEEIYVFFGIDYPGFAFQFVFEKLENPEDVSVFAVRSGNAIAIPRGYHTSVAMPEASSQYLWIMSAREPAFRRNDLAQNHPAYRHQGE